MKNRWKFTSVDDVRRFWRTVRPVPWRTEGRKHDHEERYSLGLYLLALAEHQLLTYPLCVEKGEPPDFMITWPSGEITGLEVTRATEPWLQRRMTSSEREYRDREQADVASGHTVEPVCIPLSQDGWAGDEAEVEWCALIRKAVEHKLTKLRRFKMASRHDLLVYDDTPLPTVDRRKVLTAAGPWADQISRTIHGLGKISVIVSLDVLFDLGGKCQIFPYIDWAAPKTETPADLRNLSERIEHAGRIAVERAIGQPAGVRKPLYFTHATGKTVKLMPNGRCFEVRLKKDGETVIAELPRG